MATGWRGLVLAAITATAWGQTPAPSITREGILPPTGPQWLEPGQFVAIYGQHLAPPGGCSDKLESKAGVFPTDACDTHVTVNGFRAGLQFIGERQINIKLPANIASPGPAVIAVTVQGAGSQEITVPIGRPKLMLSVAGHAYVHMPVWIAHNVPVPYRDPIHPVGLSGGRFEARYNGVLLRPLEIPVRGGVGGSLGGAVFSTEPLPLHLHYRFDMPGHYEVRYIATRTEPDPPRGMRTVIVGQSDWTPLEIEPFSDVQRMEWIRERAREMPSAPEELIRKAIPELLALPDSAALTVLMPLLYHPDEAVRRYLAAGLAMFDRALVAKQLTPIVREKGLTEDIARLLDQDESLFEGGHDALMAALPKFLTSRSALAQAGALQYIVWEPNHDWGKQPQFQTRRTSLVMGIAPEILASGNAHLHWLLALALGSIKTDPSREMLWQMIDAGKATEQSMIALTWIGDTRDLPRLAGLMDASLAYNLRAGYGGAALPWLRKAARETNQPALRLACAKELVIAGEPDGFQYLLQAMDEVPSFSSEALQFVRDRIPELRDVDQGKVLDYLRLHATTR